MKACTIFAASLFGALVAAAPVNKRHVVWVTETAVDIVTLSVTATVWVGANEAEPTTTTVVRTADGGFGHRSRTRQTISTSASVVIPAPISSVYVAPTTTSVSSAYVAPIASSSVYVEPTTASTSEYVAPTSTAVSVAPTTSTAVSVAPTTTAISVAPTTTAAPTSTYVAPSSTSSAAAATSSAAAGSSSGLAASGTTYTGDLTWYDTGLGACGVSSTSADAIVAISMKIFDAPEYATANPNLNPLCGKSVSITGKDGSKYTAKVVDRCVGCAEGDLDLSSTLFNKATNNGDGRVGGMTWTWL